MLVLRAVGNSGKPEGQVVIQGILKENIWLLCKEPKSGGAIAHPPGSYGPGTGHVRVGWSWKIVIED